MSSTNFKSILIFASCVVGTRNIRYGYYWSIYYAGSWLVLGTETKRLPFVVGVLRLTITLKRNIREVPEVTPTPHQRFQWC